MMLKEAPVIIEPDVGQDAVRHNMHSSLFVCLKQPVNEKFKMFINSFKSNPKSNQIKLIRVLLLEAVIDSIDSLFTTD